MTESQREMTLYEVANQYGQHHGAAIELLNLKDNLAATISILEQTRAERDKLREKSNWQPIETAPQDGTQILGSDESGHIEKCWWETFAHLSEWVTTGGFSSYPTHWMPLPSLPKCST